jgi:branched-chain amino acid transport system substrate-binding protein
MAWPMAARIVDLGYSSEGRKHKAWLDYRDPTSTAVYAGLQVFKMAMNNISGAVTKATVLQAMGTVKNETLDGLLAQPITFQAGQPAPKVNCFWLYKYKAGDKDFTALTPQGTSGNGAQGDLASACFPPS